MVTTCRTNSRVSFLKSLGTRSPLRSNLIERPLDATHWDTTSSVSLPCCTYERFDGFVDDCTRFSKSRRIPERYMVAGEKKNLYMTSYLKISRSRVGTLGRVFRRFQRSRKILRKRPRRFENLQAGFSGVEFFQFVQ